MAIWDIVGIATGSVGGKASDFINTSLSNTIGNAVQQVVGGGVLYNTIGTATNLVADPSSLLSKIPAFQQYPGLYGLTGLPGNNTFTLSDNNSFQYYGTAFQAKHGVGEVNFIDHQPGLIRKVITALAVTGVVAIAGGIIAAKVIYTLPESSSNGSTSSSSGGSGDNSGQRPSITELQNEITQLQNEQKREQDQQNKAQQQQDKINKISNILGPSLSLVESTWLAAIFALEVSASKVEALKQEVAVMTAQLASGTNRLNAVAELAGLPVQLSIPLGNVVAAISAALTQGNQGLLAQSNQTQQTLAGKTGSWFGP